MKFALEEILTLIDKVKSTELASFQYSDADTKIKIHGTGYVPAAPVMMPVSGMPVSQMTSVQGAAQNASAAGAAAPVRQSMPIGQMTAESTTDSYTAAEAAASGEGAEASAKVLTGKILESPMVGTFYTAPAEDAEPFVKVGDAVKKGQTIAIVEAMKLMNEVKAEWDGTVEEIQVDNMQMVEYGQPLMRISGK